MVLMKGLVLLSIILIFLPTVFQYIYGNRSVNNEITFRLEKITALSVTSHIFLTIFSVFLTNFTLIEIQGPYSCAMPTSGIIVISAVLFIVLITILIIQSNRKG